MAAVACVPLLERCARACRTSTFFPVDKKAGTAREKFELKTCVFHWE
jgi:hypothetical protein